VDLERIRTFSILDPGSKQKRAGKNKLPVVVSPVLVDNYLNFEEAQKKILSLNDTEFKYI
jgi:hypothetical protein